jgi:glycerol-3-phosphate cytidylyltransferase
VKPRVYTAGTFDLFHAGHANFLAQCAEFGDVTVALNTDRFVEAYKGAPPVIDYEGREDVVRACRYVAEVIPQDRHDLRPQVLEVAPNVILVGSDWAAKDYAAQTGLSQEWLDEQGFGFAYVPYTDGVSTTAIRERLVTA